MNEQQMTDKASINWEPINNTNGKAPQDKPKKPRKLVGIPTTTALTSLSNVFYQAYVAKDPVGWDAIANYQFYSPSADGSRLMMKVSKSKSVDIKTRQSEPTGYGQAYPVELSTNPTTNKDLY